MVFTIVCNYSLYYNSLASLKAIQPVIWTLIVRPKLCHPETKSRSLPILAHPADMFPLKHDIIWYAITRFIRNGNKFIDQQIITIIN